MSNFEEYIVSLGYKRYRKVYENKKWAYIEDNSGYNFSTMLSGWIDYRYLKDGEHEIIFGLSEREKPPTLCYPRPKGILNDDEMNRQLKTKTPQEIYSLIAKNT